MSGFSLESACDPYRCSPLPSSAYNSAVGRQTSSPQGRRHAEDMTLGSNCGASRIGLPGTAGMGRQWCAYTNLYSPQACLSQGKPKPQASWTHNGHTLDSKRVNVRSGDQDSILFIRSAQREDSGRYELTVHLEGLEAKASIDILVIGTRAVGKGPFQNHCPSRPIAPLTPTPELTVGEGRLGCHAWRVSDLGCGDGSGPASLMSLHNLLLQRSLDPQAASGSWTSGVAMLPSSGLHPRTQAIQNSWATRCRRRTKRQG